MKCKTHDNNKKNNNNNVQLKPKTGNHAIQKFKVYKILK